MNVKDLVAELRGEIAKPLGRITGKVKEARAPELDELHFKCNDCGRCCINEEYSILVTLFDIKSWIDKKEYLPLALVWLEYEADTELPVFTICTKAEYRAILAVDPAAPGIPEGIVNEDFFELNAREFSASFVHRIEAFNPSVMEDLTEENARDCIFYVRPGGHCAIYGRHPLTCKVYPHDYIIKQDSESILCDASCLDAENVADETTKEQIQKDMVAEEAAHVGLIEFFTNVKDEDIADFAHAYCENLLEILKDFGLLEY
jgi:Fe-S-cluster containining protein